MPCALAHVASPNDSSPTLSRVCSVQGRIKKCCVLDLICGQRTVIFWDAHGFLIKEETSEASSISFSILKKNCDTTQQPECSSMC